MNILNFTGSSPTKHCFCLQTSGMTLWPHSSVPHPFFLKEVTATQTVTFPVYKQNQNVQWSQLSDKFWMNV
jgi:hypothetical protein